MSCDPNEAIPRTCAEAFERLGKGQAAMQAQLAALVDEAKRTNGNVGQLRDRTDRHETKLGVLSTTIDEMKTSRSTWARRLWQLVVGAVLVLAGYWLKSG